VNQSRGYLTAGETAEYYHVPLDTLRYWRHVGKGPVAVRPGKDPIYPLTEIVRFDAELLVEARARAAARNPRGPGLTTEAGAEHGVVPIVRTRGRRRERRSA
jgi:hypothetical protein